MKIKQTSRARGGNRGGVGGGYEATNPEYEQDKAKRLLADYRALDPMWRERFVRGLPKAEQVALDRLLHPQKYA